MTIELKGVFQITGWDEKAYSENEDGTKQSHAKIIQTYSGAIEGSSELQYLMSYQPDGSAVFVGFEVVSGSISGKSGSFVIQHTGKFALGVASSNFIIVPQSGKGELTDITGNGSFTSGEHGKANYNVIIDS